MGKISADNECNCLPPLPHSVPVIVQIRGNDLPSILRIITSLEKANYGTNEKDEDLTIPIWSLLSKVITSEASDLSTMQFKASDGKFFIPALFLQCSAEKLAKLIREVHMRILNIKDSFDTPEQKEIVCSSVNIVASFLSELELYYKQVHLQTIDNIRTFDSNDGKTFDRQRDMLLALSVNNCEKLKCLFSGVLMKDVTLTNDSRRENALKILYSAFVIATSQDIFYDLFHDECNKAYGKWIHILKSAIFNMESGKN